MFKFIGVGSAFNTTLGNTSAFLDYGNDKILFDSGETVFSALNRSEFWTGHNTVFITHNHPDHIGSLGSFIFYAFYIKKDRPTVYGNSDLKVILNLMGVREEFFDFVDIKTIKTVTFDRKGSLKDGYVVAPVQNKHAKDIASVGYIVKESNSGTLSYYSGDESDVPELVLQKFSKGKINYLYLDVSWLDYPDNVHMSYKKLCEKFPDSRERIYIMHLDNNFNESKALADGFKLAGKE